MPQQRKKKLGRPKITRIKANTAHSRAFKHARRQRNDVDPPMPEHQSTNHEPSEHEASNHSDNEDIETSSLSSLKPILRPQHSDNEDIETSSLPSFKSILPRPLCSDNEDIETSSLSSLKSILPRPQSHPPSPPPQVPSPQIPSPQISPSPQPPRSNDAVKSLSLSPSLSYHSHQVRLGGTSSQSTRGARFADQINTKKVAFAPFLIALIVSLRIMDHLIAKNHGKRAGLHLSRAEARVSFHLHKPHPP